VAGLVTFVVEPALQAGIALGRTALRGAFFGLVAYATYDLTKPGDRGPLAAPGDRSRRGLGHDVGCANDAGQR
jgi:hypothetical protein